MQYYPTFFFLFLHVKLEANHRNQIKQNNMNKQVKCFTNAPPTAQYSVLAGLAYMCLGRKELKVNDGKKSKMKNE